MYRVVVRVVVASCYANPTKWMLRVSKKERRRESELMHSMMRFEPASQPRE
jgi:hypothetical protein